MIVFIIPARLSFVLFATLLLLVVVGNEQVQETTNMALNVLIIHSILFKSHGSVHRNSVLTFRRLTSTIVDVPHR